MQICHLAAQGPRGLVALLLASTSISKFNQMQQLPQRRVACTCSLACLLAHSSRPARSMRSSLHALSEMSMRAAAGNYIQQAEIFQADSKAVKHCIQTA